MIWKYLAGGLFLIVLVLGNMLKEQARTLSALSEHAVYENWTRYEGEGSLVDDSAVRRNVEKGKWYLVRVYESKER